MKNIAITVFLILTTLILNCQYASETNKNQSQKIEIPKPEFIHAVYFWIKKDADPIMKKGFIDGLDNLAKIESIQNVYYGPPAMTDRDVVDNSYDYAWITNFATSADHDKYQVDPIHIDFVEKYKELWSDVKVYDNLVRH